VANVGGQRRHGSQGFAKGGAVVGGNPAAEFEESGVERGLFVQQAERFAGGRGGGMAVGFEYDSGELAGSEGDQHAASDADAVAEGFGQAICEGLVERNRQADVAIERGFGGQGSSGH
jgi:hypothetical protein